MKNKIFTFVLIFICFSILTLLVYNTHSSKSINTQALSKARLDNDYFIKNNMTNGLWGLERISYDSYVQNEVEKNQKIRDIKVAIIDTGIDLEHPDLKENIIEGINILDPNQKPYDDNGHGTQIAGIIGGKYTGIATGVKLIPIKVLESNGFGKTEDLVKGIIWAVDNEADIINLSIGRRKSDFLLENEDTFNELEYKAIKYALLNNVVVVTVSGDFNDNNTVYPAGYFYKDLNDKPIVVTAINQTNGKATMANFSSQIDIAAPGEYILTTTPKHLDKEDNDYINAPEDGYIFCRGTSFAAAYVSGIASYIKSKNKNLSNEQVRVILENTTSDIGEKGKDEIFGWGLIHYHKVIDYFK